MKATLLLDYVTFNFDAGSIDLYQINDVLAGNVDLKFHKVGLSDNSVFVSPFGLSYLNNSGFEARPHRLQVSGVGCVHFEPVLPVLREYAPNHISRLDFAFDVVCKKQDWRDYLKSNISATFDCTRQAKKYNFAGSGEATTIYIGSRKCAKYCRIYNKTLEDPDYQYISPDGGTIQIADDEYIIRYEVELKRFKSKVQNFDPSYLFDAYYYDPQVVIDFVKDVWRLYGEDFLLPCPIEELELEVRTKRLILLNSESRKQYVIDNLYSKPQAYSNTVRYVADRFGKYIPFIIADPLLRNLVLQQCEVYCGFKLDVIVAASEAGFYDFDEKGDESCKLQTVCEPVPVFDQLTI